MVLVSAEIKKQKEDKYRGVLLIKNNYDKSYTSYTIKATLPSGSSIEKCDDMEVNGSVLTPEKKIATLEKGADLELSFKGDGVMPTVFEFVGGSCPGPGPGPTPGPGTDVYNLAMTNLKDISQVEAAGFKFQWSYDKQDGYSESKPNPAYFKIVNGDDGKIDPAGLELNLYSSDKTFKKGSPTFPRTELRGLATIKNEQSYLFTFEQYLVTAPAFDYCFAQVFGGPSLIFRYRSGSYQILSAAGKKETVADKSGLKPADLVGKWHTWKFEFMMSSRNGYSRMFLDDKLLASVGPGDNQGKYKESYIKCGLYAQQMNPTNDVKGYIKNFVVKEEK